MRKFRFGLQRLLDYRRTVEDMLLGELAAVQAEHGRETERLARMVRERDAFRKRVNDLLSDADAARARDTISYLAELCRRVIAQEETVNEVQDRKRMKTEQVLEAAKDRKALERLREHKLEEHRRESGRQEQLFLDDVATISHVRTRAA